MNGIDHAEPEPRIPEIIRLANEQLPGRHDPARHAARSPGMGARVRRGAAHV